MATAEVLRYKVVVDASDASMRMNKFANTTKGATSSASAGFASLTAAVNPYVLAVAAATAAAYGLAKGIKFSVDKTIDFEAAMANVASLVDTSKVDIKGLGSELKALGPEYGTATENALALYDAVSARGNLALKGGGAVEFIRQSAIAAKAGLVDTKTAVDAGTSLINAYGLESKKVTDVFDQMFVAVKAGKTTFGELAQSIGKVAPIAKSAGVNSDELLGSISALTKQGIKTKEAITALKAAFSNIIKPQNKAADMADELGLQFDSTALKSKGLLGFMKELQKTLQKKNALGADGMVKSADKMSKAVELDIDKFAKLFGSVEALNAMLALASQTGGEDFTQIMEDMKKSSGETETAFKKQTSTMKGSIDKWDAALEKLGITVGEKLIPVLQPMLEWAIKVVEKMGPVIDSFAKFVKWIIDGIKWLESFSLSIGPLKVSLADFIVPWHGVITVIKNTWEALKLLIEWLGNAGKAVANSSIGKGLKKVFDTIVAPFEFVANKIKDLIDYIVRLINKIPGIKIKLGEDIPTIDLAAEQAKEQAKQIADLAKLWGEVGIDIESAIKQIENSFKLMDEPIKVPEFVKTFKDLESWLRSMARMNPEIIIDIKGSGSSVAPLGEKIKEMAGLMDEFGNQIEKEHPTLTVAFQDITGDSLSTAMSTLEGQFNNMFDSIIAGTFNVKESFKGMVTSIMAAVGKMLASQAIASFVGMLGSSIGSMFGGGSPYIPALAEGGKTRRGKAHLVGERGPELFVPDRAGSVMPNGSFGGGGSFTNVNNITVESSGGNADEDRKQANDIARAIDEKIKMQIAKQMRPGGVLNPTRNVAMGMGR